jgi:hypothetical protein
LVACSRCPTAKCDNSEGLWVTPCDVEFREHGLALLMLVPEHLDYRHHFPTDDQINLTSEDNDLI